MSVSKRNGVIIIKVVYLKHLKTLYATENNQKNDFGTYLYLIQDKLFFLPLVQLLSIISFFFLVSTNHQSQIRETTGICEIDLAMYEKACKVSIP